MSEATDAILIVGAGHAGCEMATSLRQEGFDREIIMIGEEAYLPYQRPPLSKAFLSGSVSAEGLSIKPQATYDKATIQCITGRRVETIDRSRKSITMDDGTSLHYAKLVLATGGQPRRLNLAGSEAAEYCKNFGYLRTIEDAERIRRDLVAGKRIVIIGGGYIGLEIAAAAIQHHLDVTVLEGAPRVLARVTAPVISEFYEQVHRSAGVKLLTGTAVEQIECDEAAGLVTGVVCTDGLRLPADMVVVGIGLIPNIDLAEMAGLTVTDGIEVDAQNRTSDPDIFAIGDCANYPNPLLDQRVRIESVPNALEHARIAAAAICGKHKAYTSMPWFWSDQYDLKLQMVGLSTGHDQVVLRGDVQKHSFVAFYLQGNRVIAADAVSRPQDFMFCKRMVTERLCVNPAELSDQTISLKTILAAPAA